MVFSYRHAKMRDIPGLLFVMSRSSFQGMNYLDFVYEGNRAKAKEDLKRRIADPKFGVLVCIKPCTDEENCILDERIIAYFVYGPLALDSGAYKNFPDQLKDNYAMHLGVGVDPEFAGQGIGRMITAIALDDCRSQYSGMYADVDEHNTASLKLQKRSGFSEVARFPDDKRKGNERILFRIDF